MNRGWLLTPVLLMLALLGCAHGRIVNGTFVSDDYGFSVALPGPPYERIMAKGALVAVTDSGTGASIAIAVSPDTYTDANESKKALDYITRDLFFFLTKKKYRVFEDVMVGGVQGRHAILTGMDDDKELIFSAYVTQFSGMIYDVVFWCEPQYFDTASAVFEKMVGTFVFRPGADK